MPIKPERTLTPEDFEDLATKIASIADGYRKIAEAMRERNIAELSVFGVDTLETVTLHRVNGPVHSAQRALLSAKPTKSSRNNVYRVAEDPEKLRIAGDAAKANRTAANRKKKKPE